MHRLGNTNNGNVALMDSNPTTFPLLFLMHFFCLSSAQPQANESPLKHENRKMKTIHKPPKERQRGWGQKQGQNAVEK